MDNNQNDRDKAFEELFSDNPEPQSYTYDRERKSYNRSNAMRRAKSRRVKTKKLLLMIAVAVVLLALWIVCAAAIINHVFGNENPSGEEQTGDSTNDVLDPSEGSTGDEDPATDPGSTPQGITFTTIKMGAEDYKYGTLILISSAYKYDQSGDTKLNSELVEAFDYCNGSFLVATNTDHVKIRFAAINAMNNMFAACKTETGIDDYCIRDYYAWCTKDDQGKWFTDAEAKHGANAIYSEFKAGESEHEAGYTFDLKVDPGRAGKGAISLAAAIEADSKYSWIYDNCYKYGIINRYTQDKVGFTGVKMNASSLHAAHFRYVGVAAATAMKQNNWCLEELIINLEEKYTYNGEHLKVEASDGKKYEMYYYPAVKGSQTEVKVPESLKYEISGDNVNGYIVTMEMK